MNNNQLGLSWELENPKCDPEFLYHMVFVGNRKGEVVNYNDFIDWMLKLYLLNDPTVLNLRSKDNKFIWELKRITENILAPMAKLWVETKLLRSTGIVHNSAFEYELLVEPKEIDRQALLDKRQAYKENNEEQRHSQRPEKRTKEETQKSTKTQTARRGRTVG